MIIFLLPLRVARRSPYPPNTHPGCASREGLSPPPPSLAEVILELDDAPFKREVKYVVFFIAGTMRRSDYRREK